MPTRRAAQCAVQGSPEPDPGVSVTAVGSCRVLGPLRKAGSDACFSLNQSGVYGYCHSSAEALQQLRVLNGTFRLPEHLLPVVAPRSAETESLAASHIPSDMYIVELSSAKILTIDGVCVQLNYFTRHFQSFFSDRQKSRAFWKAVRENDFEARKSVIDAGPERLPTDRYMLENLRMELSSEESLSEDINAITSLVPHALFVTHFNARKRDGLLLSARENYLRSAVRALETSGVKYFDPSDYVEAFGQSEALADSTGSLSHYSEEFEAFLCNNWTTRYIKPLADGRTARRVPHEPKRDMLSQHFAM